jgi:hypothetical protein
MFMARLESIDRFPCGRPRRHGLLKPVPCPADFEERFITIGRLQCEEYYQVGRLRINDWLKERGEERLIAARANYVREQRSSKARERRMKREVGFILKQTYPVRGPSLTLAREAAQFLRAIRNGGWIVSPAPNGMWFVGARKMTAEEMVRRAVAKGFGANLSPTGDHR